MSSGRTPLYKQIREYILDQIRQSNWGANEKIPSENELSAQFDVSRITVKNALQELIEEGLIYRIQGKGSFVAGVTPGEPVVYRPAGLRAEKTVAYLMPRLDNRFTANLLNGIENQLAEDGCRLLFCETHDSQETEKQLLKSMLEYGVQGIIIYPTHGQTFNEDILKLTLNHFPIVVVDRYLRGVETNTVCSDNVAAAYDAAIHLIGLGHRHIGFISTQSKGTTSMEDRLFGYEKALFEHRIPVDHQLRLVHLDSGLVNTIYRNGEADAVSIEEIKHFLAQNEELTAVICVNTAVGLTFMEASKQSDRSIPQEISVVVLDDYELSAFSAIPPTCVSQEEYTIGREAAKLLTSIMRNPHQQRQKVVVPTRLIERQSTGPAPK